jgi:hypothetical protein
MIDPKLAACRYLDGEVFASLFFFGVPRTEIPDAG